jgi:hypothetical protein
VRHRPSFARAFASLLEAGDPIADEAETLLETIERRRRAAPEALDRAARAVGHFLSMAPFAWVLSKRLERDFREAHERWKETARDLRRARRLIAAIPAWEDEGRTALDRVIADVDLAVEASRSEKPPRSGASRSWQGNLTRALQAAGLTRDDARELAGLANARRLARAKLAGNR